MRQSSVWSNTWQRWTRTWTRRPRAACRTVARLESLEQRLNLAAVLVVETVDAYWLIEDPLSDSLTPSGSADELCYGLLFGSAGDDEIGLELPASVTPANSDGAALTQSEAQLTESLLSELWYTEPDFYYEDVLAVTYYSGTSIDALIDSGMFDGSDSADSFSGSDFVASDVFGESSFTNNSNDVVVDDVSDAVLDTSNEASASRETSALTRDSRDDATTEDSGDVDVIAAARAEVASWSQRLASESLVSSNTARAIDEQTLVAVVVPPQNLERSASTTDGSPVTRDNSLPSSTREIEVVAASVPQEAAIVREPTKLESFFARFPSLGFGTGRASLLRIVRGESAAPASNDSLSGQTEDASGSLSYSQWASLFGVISLLGVSQWRGRSADERETPVTPFQSKNNGKRPVAC